MERFTLNISGTVRTEYINNVEYRVVPLSMLIEGVLKGSRGPVFYPAKEIQAGATRWNKVPITNGHPMRNGKYVYAMNDPDVLLNEGLGFVQNAEFDSKLVAEGWLDVAACNRLQPEIITNIDAGIPIDLSTGLNMDQVEAPDGATFNGKAYTHIATNHQPDHLAILLHSKGACTLADGCGVLVNEELKTEPTLFVNAEGATTLIYEKNTTNIAAELDDWLTVNELSHSDLHQQLDTSLRSKFTQDEPHAWIVDVFDSFIVYRMGEDLFKLSYTKTRKGVKLSSDSPQRVNRETSIVPVTNTEENPKMADKALVDQVITNSAAWAEKDRSVLEALDEIQLKSLVPEPAVNEDPKPVAPVVQEPANNCGGNCSGNCGEKKAEAPTANTELDLEKYLATAPKEVQSIITNALKAEVAEKERLMSEITTNMGDDEKNLFIQRNGGKDLEDIKEIAFAVNSASPKTANNSEGGYQRPIPNYFGAAGVSNASPDSYEEEPLEPLIVNYGGDETAQATPNPFVS